MIATNSRALVCSVVAAGVLVGMASPAEGDVAVLEGTYRVTGDGMPPSRWTVVPKCMPTVGDLRVPLYLPVGCRLNVSIEQGPTIAAVMVNGLWSMSLADHKMTACPDGTFGAGKRIYAFSDVGGTVTTIHDAACDAPASTEDRPFSLAFESPLPFPLDRTPLVCEPGGLRRCS
jgi:hypothetical protein